MADVVDRGRRLFEFLAEVQRLRMKPVRSVEEYNTVYWLGDLPRHPAVVSAAGLEEPNSGESLLTVERLSSVDAPAPSPLLAPWIDGTARDPELRPVLRASILAEPTRREAPVERIALADRPEISNAFHRWLEVWETWAEQELIDRPVRALYKELFSTYTSATNQTEELELVVGVGCLGWAPTASEQVQRHLFTTPAGIEFDEASGSLVVTVAPSQEVLTIELDMLDPGRHPSSERLNDVVTAARELDTDPLDRRQTGALIRRLAFALDADARYDDVDGRPGVSGSPLVTFGPALILRKRSQRGLMEVFTGIAASITQAGTVPAGLLPLLDPDRQPSAMPDPQPGAMVSVDDDVFLPLPLNEKQLDIVRRVDTQAQNLVQGPPGTGKTHLAAALISHLLAQGKRVLVTAHTDRALKEVRAKLPEAIKPLAVSVVGTERSDMADLKVAVDRISARSSDLDPVAGFTAFTTEEAERLSAIDGFRGQRAAAQAKLVEARAKDVSSRTFRSYCGTLTAIARTYRDHAPEHDWLREFVTPRHDTFSPLDDRQATRWLKLLRDEELRKDESDSKQRLVEVAQVPSPEVFASLVQESASRATTFEKVRAWTSHPLFEHVSRLDAADRESLRSRLSLICARIRAFEQPGAGWMRGALHDIRSGRGGSWQQRGEAIDRMLQETWPLLEQIPPTMQIDIQPQVDVLAVESLAGHLLGHLRGGGSVKLNPDGTVKMGALTHRVIKHSRLVFDAVRIDGRLPATPEQLTALLLSIDVGRRLDAIDDAWPAEVEVPREGTLREGFHWHVTELGHLQKLLELASLIRAEQAWFTRVNVPQPDWNDLQALADIASLVDAAAADDAHQASVRPLAKLERDVAHICAWANAADVCHRLLRAIRSEDRDQYEAAHTRIVQLHDVRRLAAERDDLTKRLRPAAPDLTAAVIENPESERWLGQLPNLEAAWNWACAGDWILAQESDDTNVLHQQIDLCEERIRGEIERLAASRAWRHALAADRLTGTARADLQQYAQLVRRLGKGTGKYAAVRRAEIRQAMDRCRPAVPVWIMPIYRIAEQVQVSENMFDVVIVDEASQAGLEATFLQYLAPRIVVIGDDKQVSPAAVGINEQELRDLANRYLWDDRYTATWQDPKRSFFDEASMRFGARQTLTEHRRCVPEIIGFSNRIAYERENIGLIPVRFAGSDRLAPIHVEHVAEGYETGSTGNRINRPEAEAIVTQIEKCVADPRYDGKTFGVISLSGVRQAQLIKNMLLERLPPEVWTERDLRCGDAADFQGSERHVMFLSMVSAPEPGHRVHARTQEGDVQRFNVASSRAQDQMWVFHSMPRDQLTNPQDLRFQLLDYCYGVVERHDTDSAGVAVSEDELVEPFDSLFEQRVYNRIIDRGYTVSPQFEAMGYRIDLVIIGATGRLAVECDGDAWHGPSAYQQDLARQRDLQRCDWQFFRIRESDYYVDSDAVLERLWQTLDSMEIRPSEWADPTVITVDDAALDLRSAVHEPAHASLSGRHEAELDRPIPRQRLQPLPPSLDGSTATAPGSRPGRRH